MVKISSMNPITGSSKVIRPLDGYNDFKYNYSSEFAQRFSDIHIHPNLGNSDNFGTSKGPSNSDNTYLREYYTKPGNLSVGS